MILKKTGNSPPARLVLFALLGMLFLFWLSLPNAAAQTSPPPAEAVFDKAVNHGQTGPARQVTYSEYWQRIADTRSWLAGNPAADSWADQAKQWGEIEEVLLPNGSVIPVDTREIVQLLRANPPDQDRLEDHLSALLEARERWSKTGDAAGELSALQKILSRPEFQGESDNFLQKIYRRVIEFLLKLLEKLFPNTESVVIPLPPELVIAMAVLLLGGIIAYVFRDIWRNLLPETEISDESAADGEILTASQALQRAQQLAGGGDYRQAVRYMYLSALLLLDERGMLRYNRSLTNREYLRQVSSRPGLSSHLRPVIETFDRVWYGFQPVDEDTYTKYVEQVSALEETKE